MLVISALFHRLEKIDGVLDILVGVAPGLALHDRPLRAGSGSRLENRLPVIGIALAADGVAAARLGVDRGDPALEPAQPRNGVVGSQLDMPDVELPSNWSRISCWWLW